MKGYDLVSDYIIQGIIMNSDDTFSYIILGIAIFFIALIIIFLIHGAAEKKRDKEIIRQEQKTGIWMSAVFTHISGLPIASGTNVKCYWYDNKIVFTLTVQITICRLKI